LWIVGIYVAVLAAALAIEWIGIAYFPTLLFRVPDSSSVVQNAPGVFVTAQVGVLAVLTVAISVVTLLVQKDNGTSVNTDVRLYYVESYAHEVATSGISLLGAIAVQLFWPIQIVIATFVTTSDDTGYRLVVTAVNTGWLVLNFGLFLHFLRTTFEFVVPSRRAEMRKRYVATEIIPGDVARRLLAAYYGSAPEQLLGAEDLKAGPLVTFGMGLAMADNVTPEITQHFRTPRQLRDVWLLISAET
jgi:hypothetical protein